LILAEPPRTNYDVHFELASVPVRIHPLFWLACLLLGIAGEQRRPEPVLIWALAMLVSILVHEFGHALTIKRFGWAPRVVLYQLGGLAVWDPSESYSYAYNPNQDKPSVKILISAMGPMAGFLFAAVVVGLVWVTGHRITFELGGALGIGWSVGDLPPLTALLVDYLLQINIFWGLMNLLPVIPLDGGQISRELFEMHNPYDGVVKSLWLSIITGAAVAVLGLVRFGLTWNGVFIALLFGMLAYGSYATLQAYRGGGYGEYGGSSDDRGW
jgi:stage IV sporulation protein FB